MFGIVPAALLGVDLGRFLEGAAAMVDAAGRGRQPRARARPPLGEGWQGGRDKVCIEDSPTGFGLWAEQLLAESTGKQGKGSCPPGEPPDGPDRQRGELELGPRTTSAASSSAGSSRPRSRATCSGSTRSTSRTQAAKDKTNEVLAAGEPDVEPRGSLDDLLAPQAQAGRDYVCIQAFVDPGPEDELAPLVERAHATGCVVTQGLGPRYLHSTGQLHKGGPNTGLFIQVVDETGDELPIPAGTSASAY